MNPKKFGGLTDAKQEPWKLPLREYNEELYFKHFRRGRLENARSSALSLDRLSSFVNAGH